MSTVSTSNQVARDKQRVQILLPTVLVAALDAYARRALLDRTGGIRESILEHLPADLREFVEAESGSDLTMKQAREALDAYLQQRS